MTVPRFVIGCASNNDTILDANLLSSPEVRAGLKVEVQKGAPSATIAYNRILDATDAEIVILAHQDVWLPQGWLGLLHERLAELEKIDPNWGLAGAFGVDFEQRLWGPVWSSSLGQIIGRVPMAPVPVQSFDEMVIILRRSSGLRFDEGFAGWHFYGSDIVCQARRAGIGAYALGLPCIHNDRFHDALGADFDEGYRVMQRKWRDLLPVRTPVIKVSRSGLHLMRDRWKMRRSLHYRVADAVSSDSRPEPIALRCGWMDLTPNLVPAPGSIGA